MNRRFDTFRWFTDNYFPRIKYSPDNSLARWYWAGSWTARQVERFLSIFYGPRLFVMAWVRYWEADE